MNTPTLGCETCPELERRLSLNEAIFRPHQAEFEQKVLFPRLRELADALLLVTDPRRVTENDVYDLYVKTYLPEQHYSKNAIPLATFRAWCKLSGVHRALASSQPSSNS